MISLRTRLFAVALGAVCLPSTDLQAAPIPLTDLFNTGVDNNHVALPNGVPDPHYIFGAPPPTGVVPITATSAGGFPIGPWIGDSPISAWITPALDRTGDAGDYVYRTTFTLEPGGGPHAGLYPGPVVQRQRRR